MAQQEFLRVEFPCGFGGLNRTSNLARYNREDLTWVDGITVENQVWEKEAGATKFNSVGLGATVLAVHDCFCGSPVMQEQVAALDDGRMVVIAKDGGVTKTLATGLTTTKFSWFSEGIVDTTTRALFLYNGVNTPKVYTGGNSAADIDDPASDWTGTTQPSAAFQHNFRSFAFGDFNSILYLSNPTNHGQFSTAKANTRIMSIFPGEEQYLAAGISWRARAYLWKFARGIFYVDDVDANIANWQIRKVTDAVGAAGPGCVVAYEDDVVFLATDGFFYSLSDVLTLGQQSVKPIFPTELGEFLKDEINMSRLANVQSTYYARKRQIWFALPSSGSSINDRRLIIDLNMADRIRVLWSTRDECEALGTRRESDVQEPIWGDSTGYIYRGDRTTRSKDSAGYTGQFETPPADLFPGGEQFGNLQEVQVVQKPDGVYDLSLEVHTDGALSQTLTVSQQGTGSIVGSFSLDADVVAGTTINNEIHELEGEARRIKFLGKNDNPNETFAVQHIYPRYKPGRHGVAMA